MAFSHQLKKLPLNFDVLVPFYQFESELVRELSLLKIKPLFQNNKILITENLSVKPIWAQDWWPDSSLMHDLSRTEAIKFLKAQPTLGHYYQSEDSKFAKSILQDIKNFQKKRIDFQSQFKFKYFTWTVLDGSLIYSMTPYSRFPEGWHEFNEDKDFPPNRAYLKLWELFTVHSLNPNRNDIAIDLGASPGGWSWVLSHFYKKVYSVDRAELDPKIQRIENIIHRQGDAFSVNPGDYRDCTWFFSDIICTPSKSRDLINNWMSNSNIKNYVCTIKFKGNCDFDILKELLSIPDSQIIHLYQNKNEVTWVRLVK